MLHVVSLIGGVNATNALGAICSKFEPAGTAPQICRPKEDVVFDRPLPPFLVEEDSLNMNIVGHSIVDSGRCVDARGNLYSYMESSGTFPDANICFTELCIRFSKMDGYRGLEFTDRGGCTCLFDAEKLPVPQPAGIDLQYQRDEGYGGVADTSGAVGSACYKYDESGSAIFSQDTTDTAFEQGNVDTEELKYPPTPQPSADLLLGESSSDPTTSPSLAATEADDDEVEIFGGLNSAYHFNCRCCFPLVSYFIFARVW